MKATLIALFALVAAPALAMEEIKAGRATAIASAAAAPALGEIFRRDATGSVVARAAAALADSNSQLAPRAEFFCKLPPQAVSGAPLGANDIDGKKSRPDPQAMFRIIEKSSKLIVFSFRRLRHHVQLLLQPGRARLHRRLPRQHGLLHQERLRRPQQQQRLPAAQPAGRHAPERREGPLRQRRVPRGPPLLPAVLERGRKGEVSGGGRYRCKGIGGHRLCLGRYGWDRVAISVCVFVNLCNPPEAVNTFIGRKNCNRLSSSVCSLGSHLSYSQYVQWQEGI